MNNILFYIFATILILAALKVITCKNPVHAVLYLVLAFVSSAPLWLMLQVEFLALALILVYVGAVMVLFLFVVMMLDVNHEVLRQQFWSNLPLALMVALIIIIEMLAVLILNPVVDNHTANDIINNTPSFLAYILYTKYSFAVEIASIILLLGLVVAVALNFKTKSKNTKFQKISQQLKAQANNRLTMVKMVAEVEYPQQEIKSE